MLRWLSRLLEAFDAALEWDHEPDLENATPDVAPVGGCST